MMGAFTEPDDAYAAGDPPHLVGPDCEVGKHQACDHRAFDHDADEVVDCACSCHAKRYRVRVVAEDGTDVPQTTQLWWESRADAETYARTFPFQTYEDGQPCWRIEESA